MDTKRAEKITIRAFGALDKSTTPHRRAGDSAKH